MNPGCPCDGGAFPQSSVFLSRSRSGGHCLFSVRAIRLGGVMPKDSKASTVLAVLRVVREWSQRELAEAAGVRPSSISDWERGKKTPSPRTLERLAGAMGFSSSMLQRALAFVGD